MIFVLSLPVTGKSETNSSVFQYLRLKSQSAGQAEMMSAETRFCSPASSGEQTVAQVFHEPSG
jgi:hypothetical protein